jgi:hypothetical protein
MEKAALLVFKAGQTVIGTLVVGVSAGFKLIGLD